MNNNDFEFEKYNFIKKCIIKAIENKNYNDFNDGFDDFVFNIISNTRHKQIKHLEKCFNKVLDSKKGKLDDDDILFLSNFEYLNSLIKYDED